MIVDRARKRIFIKTLKTAGTSIEAAIAPHVQDGIITRIGEAGHAVLHDRGLPSPSDLRHVPPDHRARYWHHTRRLRRYYNHMPATLVRARMGPAWDNFTVFCFERNPWDRVASEFRWFHGAFPERTFEEFVKGRHFQHNAPLYMDARRIIVDAIGRFENLREDLVAIVGAEMVGDNLPHMKKTRKTGSYVDLYDDTTRSIVAAACADEVAVHGYEFGAAPSGRGVRWVSRD